MLDRIAETDAAVEIFLLGLVDFQGCLALQQRLVYESTGRADGRITVLVCEHPPVISVGRLGSRAHIRLSPRELENRRLEVRWVNRGGGCLLHAPGQLAVYPIVPLSWHGFSVGAYLQRLQRGMLAAVAELGIAGQVRAGRHGIWGRSGQLVTMGVAVKSWTSYFGAYVNVEPALGPFRAIDSDPQDGTPASSLSAERRQPVKMAAVRATIVQHLAGWLGCERYYLHTGHPLLTHLNRGAETTATP